MSTTVAVLAASLLAGLLLVALGLRRGTTRHPDDVIAPTTTEHWLIERVGNHPRLRRALAESDRRVAGGVAVAVSFLVLFVAAVVIGAVFDTIDTNRGFARWDQAVSQWGPDHASTTGAEILRQLTNFGGTWYLLILMGIVGVIDWIRRRDASSLLFLLTVGVGVSLINNGLKLLDHARAPTRSPPRQHRRVLVPVRALRGGRGVLAGDRPGRRSVGSVEVPALHLRRRSRDRMHGRREPGPARRALAHRRDRRRVRRLGLVHGRRHRLRRTTAASGRTRREGRRR